jgi:hypothetical protein
MKTYSIPDANAYIIIGGFYKKGIKLPDYADTAPVLFCSIFPD